MAKVYKGDYVRLKYPVAHLTVDKVYLVEQVYTTQAIVVRNDNLINQVVNVASFGHKSAHVEKEEAPKAPTKDVDDVLLYAEFGKLMAQKWDGDFELFAAGYNAAKN